MTLAPEPLGFRCGGSSPPLARTHSGIFTRKRSSTSSPVPSPHSRRSPTTLLFRRREKSVASAIDFSPDHFRRKSTRLVSYYALFKGMAASKPTSQLSERTHILTFSTKSILWGLSRRSGFLPSRSRTLSHGSCLPGSGFKGIRSLLGVGRV
jgi:hypothetical protein